MADTTVKAAGRTPTKRIPKTVRKSLFSDGLGKGHPAVSATPSASRNKKKSENDLTPRALRALRRASLREGMVLRSSKMLGTKGLDDRQRRKRRTSASSTCSSSTSGPSSFRDMDMKLRSGNIVGTKKSARKEKAEKIIQLLREDVSNDMFILKDLPWSKWQLAIRPKTGVTEWDKKWACCPGVAFPGEYKTEIFANACERPGVYEVGVRNPREMWETYPMYCKVEQGFKPESWEDALINSDGGRGRVHKQINDVIRKRCNVYIRRARFDTPLKVKGVKKVKDTKESDILVNSLSDMRSLVHETYDYAWNLKSGKSHHRKVAKEGFVLSRENY